MNKPHQHIFMYKSRSRAYLTDCNKKYTNKVSAPEEYSQVALDWTAFLPGTSW